MVNNLFALFFSSSAASLDPGEVAVCFGDEGTWCSLYKDDQNGQIHQEYSDGEETTSSLSSDDDLVQTIKNFDVKNDCSMPSKSLLTSAISSTLNSPKQSINQLNSFAMDWNEQEEANQYLSPSGSLLFYNH